MKLEGKEWFLLFFVFLSCLFGQQLWREEWSFENLQQSLKIKWDKLGEDSFFIPIISAKLELSERAELNRGLEYKELQT